jgi:hypothetical protein
MILGTDFKFRDEYQNDTTAIELLTEPYKGVIYRYTNVGLKEQEDGTATLRFNYEFLDGGQFKEDKLREDRYFNDHLGLILNTLILDVVEMSSNEVGTNYSEEPVEEREVSSKGSAVSEE